MKRKNFDKKTLLVFHLINTDTFVAYKEANRVLPTQGHRVTPDSLRKKKSSLCSTGLRMTFCEGSNQAPKTSVPWNVISLLLRFCSPLLPLKRAVKPNWVEVRQWQWSAVIAVQRSTWNKNKAGLFPVILWYQKIGVTLKGYRCGCWSYKVGDEISAWWESTSVIEGILCQKIYSSDKSWAV